MGGFGRAAHLRPHVDETRKQRPPPTALLLAFAVLGTLATATALRPAAGYRGRANLALALGLGFLAALAALVLVGLVVSLYRRPRRSPRALLRPAMLSYRTMGITLAFLLLGAAALQLGALHTRGASARSAEHTRAAFQTWQLRTVPLILVYMQAVREDATLVHNPNQIRNTPALRTRIERTRRKLWLLRLPIQSNLSALTPQLRTLTTELHRAVTLAAEAQTRYAAGLNRNARRTDHLTLRRDHRSLALLQQGTALLRQSQTLIRAMTLQGNLLGARLFNGPGNT